jgi:hypothetical protein
MQVRPIESVTLTKSAVDASSEFPKKGTKSRAAVRGHYDIS